MLISVIFSLRPKYLIEMRFDFEVGGGGTSLFSIFIAPISPRLLRTSQMCVCVCLI